jgi:hypothetical protein
VLLFDVGEEGGVGEVPLAAGTAEFAFCFFLGLNILDGVGGAFFLAHKYKLSIQTVSSAIKHLRN